MTVPKNLAEFLLSLPQVRDLSERAHVLLVVYFLRLNGKTHFSCAELSTVFLDGGLAPPRSLAVWLSDLSKGRKGALLRVSRGRYSLSIYGLQEVEQYLETATGISPARVSLEKLVGRLAGDAERKFLAEAIACIQVGARRAAVVMVWLLTVDHLQRYVLAHKLNEFNTALHNRNDYHNLTIATEDDFSEIRKEQHFIEVLRSASIITNDVRKILEEKLGFRNSCAHPSGIEIPDTKVIAAIEDLVENVIIKFPL